MIYIQRSQTLRNMKSSQTSACRADLRRVAVRRRRVNLNLIQVCWLVVGAVGFVMLAVAGLGFGFLLGLVLAS